MRIDKRWYCLAVHMVLDLPFPIEIDTKNTKSVRQEKKKTRSPSFCLMKSIRNQRKWLRRGNTEWNQKKNDNKNSVTQFMSIVWPHLTASLMDSGFRSDFLLIACKYEFCYCVQTTKQYALCTFSHTYEYYRKRQRVAMTNRHVPIHSFSFHFVSFLFFSPLFFLSIESPLIHPNDS